VLTLDAIDSEIRKLQAEFEAASPDAEIDAQ
jgi:hypothetical protein